jgi:hypothetical protein
MAIAAQSEFDAANAEIEKAKKLKEKSFTTILLEEGLNLLLDMLGVNDIIDCFTKGDLMACGSMIMSALPVGRIFKVAKSIWKAVDRGMSAFKAWRKTVSVAETILSKADDVLSAAKSKLDDAMARFKSKADDVGEAGDGCLTNSFAPETPVLLADGSLKKIGDIGQGDVVLATDPQTKESVGKEVVAHISGEGIKDLVDITVQTPAIEKTIVATARHPFWVESKSSWVAAIDLQQGMALLTPSGESVTIAATRHYTEWKRVNNLTIADIHTYYVMAGGEAVLVHNCGIEGPKDHVALGRDPRGSNLNVKAFADQVDARHLMASSDWRGAVQGAVRRLGRGEGKISFMLDGLPGANKGPAAALERAQQALKANNGSLLATQWELLEVNAAGLMHKVDFYRFSRKIGGWAKL